MTKQRIPTTLTQIFANPVTPYIADRSAKEKIVERRSGRQTRDSGLSVHYPHTAVGHCILPRRPFVLHGGYTWNHRRRCRGQRPWSALLAAH